MPWLIKSKPSDTGVLSMNSLIPERTAGDFTIQRVGRLVFLTVYELDLTPNNGVSTWTAGGFLPPGFRFSAPAYRYFSAFARTKNHNTGNTRIDRYGGVAIYDVADKTTNVSVVWVTDDEWPTNLPGVKI